MKKIFFDVETKNTFDDVGERNPALLDVSLVGIYDSENDKFDSFLENELQNLWPLFEKADSIIGFNSDHFDIPLLNKYYSGDLTKIKSVDIMKDIKKSLGRRIGLDAVAKATLGIGKTGHGMDAIEWWKKGEIDKIRQYCLDDVRITKDVYNFALQNGHLKYSDGFKIREIPIDTSEWEKKESSGITQTLGF
ncbi:ribonuclease H-like domain-containing protein [Patescibacteria group bacterium]|nr:ribonuclease H-like domain-containing protein [Patescibacteria group bacterium]MBU4057687.1 ribonuclease H-like domain-containing protein [Patescibacteria group bacterium]MBU4115814.1 ribonuclease H-like domain-containing protein [Patescibacteria group bacterium]